MEKLYTRKLRTILQSRYIFKILALLFLGYAFLITNIYKFHSKYSVNTKSVIGVVTDFEIDGNKVTINIKAKEKLIINYYVKTKKEKNYYKNNLELGDKIKVIGTFEIPSNNTIPNIFNYRKYLYNNQIYYLVDADEIKIVSKNTNIFYYIKNMVIKRIENIDDTGYLKIFVLGINDDLDSDMLDSYEFNGVSHLFSISGSHIVLLTSIILFILKKISYNNKLIYFITILVVLFYLFLTSISPSILRSVIMFILMSINKCYNLKIKTLDIIFLVLVIAIVINPFYIYNVGFQFSYLISFSLILLSPKINNIRNWFYKNIYISFICLLVSFPISIFNFYQVNIFSIFINLILIPLVSVVVFPLALLTFIFPFLIGAFKISIFFLELLNNLFSGITIFQLTLSKPSVLLVIIYYIFIFLAIFKKRYYVFIVGLIILHKCYIYFDPTFKISFLDVGQGDSIFIKFPYNKGNILIDTGGIISYKKEKWEERSKEYSIADSKIIPYLNSLGLTKLDYLILSHGDYDHMGEAINLVNNFKVEKVIFNCGEFNELEKDLIKVLDTKKIPYYSCIKELNIDDNKLYFLNNKDYGNENDNSSVIYTKINNYKFLFMGDASIEVEEDLIEKYNLKNIEVLKVGHHGSRTSSSKSFIDEVNPKYSIISVGKNNRYGHPNKEALNNLENSKIYRTDQDGSIMFKIRNNKLRIETCSP